MLHNVTVLVLVYCNESYIVITHFTPGRLIVSMDWVYYFINEG